MIQMRWLRMLILVVLVLAVALLGIWVAQDNSTEVPLVLLGFPLGSLPLGLWLMLAFLTGVILAVLASLPTLIGLRLRARRLQRQVDAEQNAGAARMQ